MTKQHQIIDESTFTQALVLAAQVPGVKIPRHQYLSKAFSKYTTEIQLRDLVEYGPGQAGVSQETIKKVAEASIKYETTKVTLISAAVGIPGGLAMLGTVPADLVQLLAHMLRILQKLAYIYGWPDFFEEEDSQQNDKSLDDETEQILLLFLGLMMGVDAAVGALAKVTPSIAEGVAKTIAGKTLTKGVLYPFVKKIAQQLGLQMTKEIFARTVAKVVPVVGAVASGAVTLATFKPMAVRLQKHLSSLPLARPDSAQDSAPEEFDADADLDSEIIDIEAIDTDAPLFKSGESQDE